MRKKSKESAIDRRIRLELERRKAERFARDSARSKKGWKTRRKRGWKVSKATKKKISARLKKLNKRIREIAEYQHFVRVRAAKKGARTKKLKRIKFVNDLIARNARWDKFYRMHEDLDELLKSNPQMYDLHGKIREFMDVADPEMIDADRARQCQIEFGLPNIGDVYDIWWSPGKPSEHSGM
jgi:hypothetical protein